MCGQYLCYYLICLTIEKSAFLYFFLVREAEQIVRSYIVVYLELNDFLEIIKISRA